MKTTFSVIIATLNREEFVCEAIDSVLAQTFEDYELILVDDGSAAEIIARIRHRYGSRLQLVESNKQGSERAYQQGASVATGEYLAFLDDDDLYLPWTLETYHRIIQNLDSPPVILGAAEYMWEGNLVTAYPSLDKIKALKYKDYLSKDIITGIMSQSRIIMRRRVFDEVNHDKAGHPLILNDYGLILSAGTHGPCVIINSPTTVIYRQHETQATKNVEKMSRGILQLIEMARGPACSARRFDRYAFLGGPVGEWCRKAMDAQQRHLALKLLANGWPMIAAATIKRLQLMFRTTESPYVLPYDDRTS